MTNPPPASEVRRRGARIRRRNIALATVGGMVAVGVIAMPLALAASGDRHSGSHEPDFASAPAPQDVRWSQTIPAAFGLGNGMDTKSDPAYVGTEPGEVVLPEIDICNVPVWSPAGRGVVDVLGAVWSDGVEGGEQRTLALYQSDAAAQDVLDEMRSTVAACPEPAAGHAYVHPIVLQASAGDDAVAYMDQYGDADGPSGEGNAYVITRVGNALLLDKTYFGSAGSPEAGQHTANQLEHRATQVVDDMCAFAAEPCS
ncbi:hypothetical protein ACFP8W_02400 [Nocardioides hankookensis]